MPLTRSARALPALLLCVGIAGTARAAQPKVPEGFEVRTIAVVPAVSYPSQVATAPDGSLFVAEDPMDQVGPYEADLGRVLRFREGSNPIVFAQGLRAIFGMAWHDGALYVMNMPRLTVLRDTNGDGVADEAKDLFTNLGPPPKPGTLNDHIVSGIQFGIDGYLYISVGDKGIPKATGPDGRTIQIVGGGTLRCRPDGTGAEVLTTGTRNHLEPNLDARDNLFTYDNTDDGDGWWTRVTHHVDGGYYGYPYDYHDRTDRMLPRMAEYGGGSPCGGVVYREDAWPEKYRGMALWAEWGKAKVQGFTVAPAGSTFKVAEVVDFAVPDGTENFHPIDLALSYDGRTLYVADWNMGGWGSKTEHVGRIFAITYTGAVNSRQRGTDADPVPALIKQLNHPAYNERMRAQQALIKKGLDALGPLTAALDDPKTDPLAARHLVWAIDGIAGGKPEATRPLVAALKSKVADVRAQAARALGERAVASAVDSLAALLADKDLPVRLQAVIALGRIRDAHAVPALLPLLADADEYTAFSTRQALRRIGDWKAIAAGLSSRDAKVRAGILAAMELVYDPGAAQTLSQYAADAKRPADERAKALTYLAQGHRKTKPWDGTWWGTRPSKGKAPAKVVNWEGTTLAVKAIRQGLNDPQAPVRTAAVAAVGVTNDRSALAALHKRFPQEQDPAVQREIILAFGALDDKDALPLLARTLRDLKSAEPIRAAALSSVEKIGSDSASAILIEVLIRTDLPAERQTPVIAALGRMKAKAAVPHLVKRFASPAAPVRVAAAEAVGKIGRSEGATAKLLPLIDDRDAAVRKAAIVALGELKDPAAIPALLKAADAEATRFEASLSLTKLPDAAALHVYLRGVTDKNPDLRNASATALGAIRDEVAPILEQLASRRELSPAAVPELKKVFAKFKPVEQWSILGPFATKDSGAVSADQPIDFNGTYTGRGGASVNWRLVEAVNAQGEMDLGKYFSKAGDQSAFGCVEVPSAEARKAVMAVGSDDTITVWLNGKQVYDFQESRAFKAEDVKFEVDLVKGPNRILVKSGNKSGVWQFAVALSSPTDYAFLKGSGATSAGFDPETFRAVALKGQGKADRGHTLFQDPKGLGCIKCHAVGGKGGAIGPELSSVGTKSSRDELITSVLTPSARISSGYEAVVIAKSDGKVVTGLIKSDTPEALELADADAKIVRIPKSEVDERKPSGVSIMPNGLAEGLNAQDFADLIAYLETLKETTTATTAGKAGRGR